MIRLIVGVCSIQWEKPLQNLAYQWPSMSKATGLIKDDRYVGLENLIALNVKRLYLNKIWYEMGSQCSFLQIGSNMACFIKSESNSTKEILYLLELSLVIFIHSSSYFASKPAVSTLEFTNASEIFQMIATGITNLGYMTGKGVSRIKSNT